jgi:hypothetical protein
LIKGVKGQARRAKLSLFGQIQRILYGVKVKIDDFENFDKNITKGLLRARIS